MTLWLLLESALRSLMLGAVVWLSLKAFRVRNPQVELLAWTIVLVAALAMPLLLQIATVTLPARVPVPEPVASVMTALPAPLSFEVHSPAFDSVMPPPQPVTALPFDWASLAWEVYLPITGLLLFRLLFGIAMTWRLSSDARRVCEDWAVGSDVRISETIGMPVTVGRVILLPADCAEWPAFKRRAVLSHERSHVARGDYPVLLLATFHRALFWFNPLSWWLLSRLAVLMEAASDDAAIATLRDRVSYAEVLLDIAAYGGRSPAGVAMARASTVAGRVARILRENTLPAKLGWQSRAFVAATLLPVTAVAAVTVTQSMPRESLQSFAEGMPLLSAVELVPVSLGNLAPNLLATTPMPYRVLPVAIKTKASVGPMPATPLAVAASDTTGVSAQSFASDGAKPRDVSGTWTMVSGGLGVSCSFQQTGNSLTGTCKTLSQEGPINGSVDGQKVEWRWLFNGGGVGSVHDFKVAEFKATLHPDSSMEGGVHVYSTYDKFHPSFRIQDTYLIPRLPGRYFKATQAVAPVSAQAANLAFPVDFRSSPSAAAPSSDTANLSSQPKQTDGVKPLDMNGTWSMLASGRGKVESCSFQQTGNKLVGTCKTIFGEGPVSGTIDGQKVEWRWLYKAGFNTLHDFKVAEYKATLVSDSRLDGTYRIYNTYDKFHPSFRIQDTYLIPRLPGPHFTADRLPSAPPKD